MPCRRHIILQRLRALPSTSGKICTLQHATWGLAHASYCLLHRNMVDAVQAYRTVGCAKRTDRCLSCVLSQDTPDQQPALQSAKSAWTHMFYFCSKVIMKAWLWLHFLCIYTFNLIGCIPDKNIRQWAPAFAHRMQAAKRSDAPDVQTSSERFFELANLLLQGEAEGISVAVQLKEWCIHMKCGLRKECQDDTSTNANNSAGLLQLNASEVHQALCSARCVILLWCKGRGTSSRADASTCMCTSH